MGKFKQYKITIGRTNIDGKFRTTTYNVTQSMLEMWVKSWLDDKDGVSILIEGVEVKDA